MIEKSEHCGKDADVIPMPVMDHAVLVVEDEETVRESIVMALSRIYKTYQAANGREAMEIIRVNSNIRVVISDLHMPEVNGIELLMAIRREKLNVAMILVTASLSHETSAAAIKNGAYDYMTKPVDLNELETTIQSAIHQQEV